ICPEATCAGAWARLCHQAPVLQSKFQIRNGAKAAWTAEHGKTVRIAGRELEIPMEGHELLESSEQAQHAGNRRIGVTMALFAAALAVVTMMGHRLHTEEVVLQTQA